MPEVVARSPCSYPWALARIPCSWPKSGGTFNDYVDKKEVVGGQKNADFWPC